MEAEPRRRLLKKREEASDLQPEQSEEKLSFKDLIRKNKEAFMTNSLPSTQETISFDIMPSVELPLSTATTKPPSEAPLYTDEESDSSDCGPARKKKSARKAKAPPLPRLNRLLSLPSNIYTSEETEIKETEFLRNAPLQLPGKPKPALTLDCLVSKVGRCSSGESPLLKSLLSSTDTLQLEATGQIGRLQLRRETSNPRALLRDSLKRNVIERKTQHLSTDQLLEKSVSELEVRKVNPEEDADSDYLPENNEEDEAKQLQWAIDLEEGAKPADTESDTEEEVEEQKDSEETPPVELPEVANAEESEAEDSDITEETEVEGDSCSDTEPSAEEDMSAAEEPLKSELAEPQESEPQTTAATLREVKVKPPKNRFVDAEAELGSDNEMHDDMGRRASDSDSSADDAELPELIDNAEVEEGDTARKHLEELVVKDGRELQQVMNAEFRKRKNLTDYLEGEDAPSKRQKTGYVEFDPFSGATPAEPQLFIDEEMDEDDKSRLQLLQENSRLKLFGRDLDKHTQILDEESQHYLSLIKQPSFSASSRSLLTDKADSIDRVFQDSSNAASNRAYVFKKNQPAKQPISFKSKLTGPSLRSLLK